MRTQEKIQKAVIILSLITGSVFILSGIRVYLLGLQTNPFHHLILGGLAFPLMPYIFRRLDDTLVVMGISGNLESKAAHYFCYLLFTIYCITMLYMYFTEEFYRVFP